MSLVPDDDDKKGSQWGGGWGGWSRRPVAFTPEVWSRKPGRWEVRTSPPNNGWVDIRNQVACVPYPYTHVQEGIRMHEAHHILLSPEHLYEWAHMRRMAEEVIIDAAATNNHFDITTSLDLTDYEKLLEQTPTVPYDVVCWLLQIAACVYNHDDLHHRAKAPNQGELVYGLPMQMEQFANRLIEALQALPSADPGGEYQFVWDRLRQLWRSPSPMTADRVAEELTERFPPESHARLGQPSSQGQPDTILVVVAGSMGDGRNPDESRLRVLPGGCGTKVLVFTEVKKGNDRTFKPVEGSLQDNGIREAEIAQDVLRKLGVRTPLLDGADDNYWSLIADYWAQKGGSYAGIQTSVDPTRAMLIDDAVVPTVKTDYVKVPEGLAAKGEEMRDIMGWYRDRRMFRSRRPGGSIAIDVSGSMNWDWNALHDAIRELPGMTIGLYSGCYRAAVNGLMLVIARDGRWCDPRPFIHDAGFTGGNAVDIEAMDWLGQQRGPRVWLGDGQVHSGYYGSLGNDGPATLRAAVKRHKIVRCRYVRDALEYLRNGGRRGVAQVFEADDEGLITS